MPSQPLASLPYRGRYGAVRPRELSALDLPPGRLPLRRGGRPLKQWRYVGVYTAQVMICVGAVQVGPAHQSFWAAWDRERERLVERTRLSRGGVLMAPGRVLVQDRDKDRVPFGLDLLLEETDGVETVSVHGRRHAWTRKQGGIRAAGSVRVGDRDLALVDARAIVDDSAGYHARRTAWRWAAGVGRARDGREVAFNLVDGLHDAERASERTVWVDGEPVEASAARFAAGLAGVATADGGALDFTAEAVRKRRENLLLVRSSYRQPFGTFAGTLPGGIELAEGWGVMEAHTAAW
jgi:hypothetical protein